MSAGGRTYRQAAQTRCEQIQARERHMRHTVAHPTSQIAGHSRRMQTNAQVLQLQQRAERTRERARQLARVEAPVHTKCEQAGMRRVHVVQTTHCI